MMRAMPRVPALRHARYCYFEFWRHEYAASRDIITLRGRNTSMRSVAADKSASARLPRHSPLLDTRLIFSRATMPVDCPLPMLHFLRHFRHMLR